MVGLMVFALSAFVIISMPAQHQGTGEAPPVSQHASVLERVAPAPLGRADSIRALKSARRAQDAFEVLHRRLLPRQYGLSGHSCDVVIGRWCHWHDGSEGMGPPPEAPKVIAGRERLLYVLDSIGALIPGDEWVVAQKVRYLMEAGRQEDAAETAARCSERVSNAATRSWCGALAGYAAQERGDYPYADSAYTHALAGMSQDERCKWVDLSFWLDGKAASRYDRLDCSARDSMAAGVFRLVQPLYLMGVNDLRTEFLARVTRTRIEENSRRPISNSWGDDDRETVLRYGGGLWYTQEDPPPGSSREPVVASHGRGPGFNFFPGGRALASPDLLKLEDWDFSGFDSRTRYAPIYLQRMQPLVDHQLAVFRRGDSALVVSSFDVSDDGTFYGDSLEAGMFAALVDGDGVDAPIAAPLERHGTIAVATMRTAWRAMVVSLEVLDRPNRSAARARYAVRLPPPGPYLSLSDILLYAPRDSTPPPKLADAMPLAMPTSRIRVGKPLGLFWETYGVRPQGDVFGVTLLVEPIGQSLLRRAAVLLRLADKRTPLSLQWQEVPDRADGIASRAVSVDLSLLKPGRYRIKLSVTPRGGVPIVSMREIEIIR
jgi:hypothetical protein